MRTDTAPNVEGTAVVVALHCPARQSSLRPLLGAAMRTGLLHPAQFIQLQ